MPEAVEIEKKEVYRRGTEMAGNSCQGACFVMGIRRKKNLKRHPGF